MDDDWVVLAERLPPVGLECLVYAPRDGRDWPAFKAVKVWTGPRGWWPGVGERVTHWMPAPRSPDAGSLLD